MRRAPRTYRAGLARCDITPPVGIKLAGFASRNEPSAGVYRPLRAVAVAIDDGKTPILILMAEWLGFYDKTDRVRARLAEATGIPGRQIVLSGTHTHCGPAVREADVERHGALNEDYLAEAIDRMTACAAEAWASRREAVLRFGKGRCAVARCRRKPDPGNPPKVFRPMLPHDPGPVDHDVPVITIESAPGDLRGVIFSYACHPTSRGGLEIGGDYVGFALERVEAGLPGAGSIACFLQGCGGDQKPRPVDPLGAVFGNRTVEEVRQIGEELGDAVLGALSSGPLDAIRGDIAVAQEMLELHTEPVDEPRARALRAAGEDYQRAWAEQVLSALKQGAPLSTVVPYELQTIRFGRSLAIVTLAAEMSVEFSLRLKQELGGDFAHVLPLAYTNNIIGYVPVKRQIPEEGYEVWDANMYSKRTGPYVQTTEDQIVRAAKGGLGAVAPEIPRHA